MSDSERDEIPGAGGPVMTPEGRLEGRIDRVEPAQAAEDAPIELAERPKPQRYVEPKAYRAPIFDARRSLAVKIVIGALVLGAALLVAAVVVPRTSATSGGGLEMVRDNNLVDSLLAGGEKAPLIISSEPPGAKVSIGGKPVGVTPWAGDNVWGANVPVVLELDGYKKWTGKLRGGEQTLNATLKR